MPTPVLNAVNPNRLLVADMNNDGRPDIVALDSSDPINGTPGGVSVFRNIDGLSFAAPVVTSLTHIPSGVLADLNADALPDLLVSDSTPLAPQLKALTNNGMLGFTSVDLITLGGGSIVLDDMNNDGLLDLLTSFIGGFPEGLNLHSAVTSFNFLPVPDFRAVNSTGRFISGQFNGDNLPDVVLASSVADQLEVFLNAAGLLEPGVIVPMGVGSHPTDLARADFDGDGDLDLVVTLNAFPTGRIALMLNDGNGTFTNSAEFAALFGPVSVVAADFNLDNRPDFAFSNRGSSQVSIYLNTGGTFGARQDVLVGPTPDPIASGDFNQDGLPDLVVGNSGDRTLSVRFNRGGGQF